MSKKRPIPKKIRNICYERDNYKCQYKDGCKLSSKKGDRINLHHILPEQHGGKETPDNLITLCDIHHKLMHSDFHAYYPDSRGILYKMNKLLKLYLSKYRMKFGVDDGYDLKGYLYYLTKSNKFRSGQLRVIREALSGGDVLFVAPTSIGKSLCYQLPGLLANDPTLVVSPTKSLMKDQVESIWSKMIPATYINSDINGQERKNRFEFIKEQLYKFIFVAPERFGSKDPQTKQLFRDYSYLVVDEAHEIEMWGMAFRPSYRKLGQVRNALGEPTTIALTATASKETQQHILESLGIPDAEIIVTGFYRENIEIITHQASSIDEEGNLTISKFEYIKNVIEEYPGQKILIFVPTVKTGEELLDYMKRIGVKADFYHSKIDTKIKNKIQNQFSHLQKPYLDVLISTNAFGMGIDIPDIRHVIHYSPALSITDYVQQIGRAGRDGYQSHAHLLHGPKDEDLLYFIAQRPLYSENFKTIHDYTDADIMNVRKKLIGQVDDMLQLIYEHQGREWDYILDYFGEELPDPFDKYRIKLADFTLFILFILIIYVIYNVFT